MPDGGLPSVPRYQGTMGRLLKEAEMSGRDGSEPPPTAQKFAGRTSYPAIAFASATG